MNGANYKNMRVIIDDHGREELLRPAKWDEFIKTCGAGAESRARPDIFLQSWQWGEMLYAYSRRIYRCVVEDEQGVWQVVVQIVVLPLPFGRSYFFSPRGPVVANVSAFDFLLQSSEIHKLQRRHQALFWRVEPVFVSKKKGTIEATQFSTLRRVPDVEPSRTLLLDLHLSAGELFRQMKQKTRYNIRLAQKNGVEVKFFSQQDHAAWSRIADDFWKLLTQTNTRHQIRSHPKKYYTQMITTLAATGMLEVAAAYYHNEILATNLNICFGNATIYLHGASTHDHKNLMAPYALQWAAICRAKERGFRWYDFYGIQPNEQTAVDSRHTLTGVTKFKVGFGGQTISYPGTWEFPFSRGWYKIYSNVKRIKKYV